MPEAPRTSASTLRIPRERLPVVLASMHARLAPGDALRLCVPPARKGEGRGGAAGDADDAWCADELSAVVTGAGFSVDGVDATPRSLVVRATRARTLPDMVGPGMRLLVCGLNPSLYSADRGVGYARPGNRFWPAALEAGVVRRDRDPQHALTTGGVGMTDLVKRATVAAAELTGAEYRVGAARVERLVRWLEPAAICFVGLAGWRVAVDRGAVAGRQPQPFGGRPAYVMPSTSGLNAHASLADLVRHLAAAAILAAEVPRAATASAS